MVAADDRPGRHDQEILPFSLLQTALPDMEKGMAWRNLDFLPGMPVFSYELIGQRADGSEDERYLIVLWDASPEQMNDFYVNRFEMLCRLVGQALNRAAVFERIPADSKR